MRPNAESPLSFQTEGIVIRTHASGDSSLVVKIMTAERGKLAIFAKNARSNSKSFRNGLELFDAGLFTLTPGGGDLLKVSEFISRPAFRVLREDIDKLTTAGAICEAVDILSGDTGEAHLYQILQLGLSAISEAKTTKDVLRATFLGLGSLLVRQGFLDPESEPAPTARGLERFCTTIEDGCGQRFNSREAILMIAKGLAAIRT
jgi:DNA repair protein RecO